ncbi:MAG: alpha/beta hydrolase, partial [Candidatus Moranbacteria bacterium]|nr:alpha/beta hydrolase [Candidatus Moranbacteria bacterium]
MKIKRKLAIILLIFFINLSPISLSSLFNNSQAVVSQDINFDQEWTTDQVIDKVVTIRAGVTLTVRSGVTLTFDSGSINVLGKMVISGTSENPVKMRRSENSASYSVAVSPGGNLVMRNVDMSGAGAGVFQVQNKTYLNTAYAAYQGGIHMKGGSLDAQGCNFHDNDVAIYVNNNSTGKVVVNRSKFSNNKLLDVAFEDRLQSDIINFKYNWWGNASGPQETCEVYGTEKYCYYDKIGGSVDFSDWLREENFHDPVIIVPGIMGSWKLTNGGELKLDPIFGTYDDLVEIFEKNGYEKGKDLFEFPYQWRDSNVNNAKLLHDKIAEIKQEKNWPKVDLVAHSMGGLMAREYIESSYYKNDIDQLVTMGTPHAGSPEDYLIWDGGSMPPSSSAIIGYISKLVFKQEAEEAGYDNIFDYLHKMPIKSVQELLPTYDYLYDVESNKLRSYLNGESYPKNIFLDNLNLPSNKNKLGNVEVTNITGKLKSNKTINKIRVERPSSSEDDIWAHGKPENYDSLFGDHGLEYGSGDGTVPAESAEKISSDRKIELAAAHSELPSEGAATAYSILAGKNPQVSVNKTLIGNMLAIFGFSPIDIQVISPSGLKYGKDFENDKSFKNINGSYYTGFDTENEFITIPNPEEGKYRIVTQGTEEGGDYRIEVSNVSRNDDAGQVTASTVAISGIATPEKIEESKVEVSGDLVVKENLDILAPSTSNSLEGILGTNDWHTSDV